MPGCLLVVFLVGWGRLVLLEMSLFDLPLVHPIGFGLLCLWCHLLLGIFKFPLWFLQHSLVCWVACCRVSVRWCLLPLFPWWLISSLIALGSYKLWDRISISFHVRRLAWWRSMWSVLGNVRCALERSVYPAWLGWKALYIWRKCPVVQCIIEGLGSLVDFMSGGPVHWWESGVKAPCSDCVSVHFSFYGCSSCLLHCGDPVLGAYRFPIPISSPWIDPWPLRNDLLCVLLICFIWRSLLSDGGVSTPSLF